MRPQREETKVMSRNLVTERRIDDACRLLREVARIEGLHRVVLHVYADGRVDIERVSASGHSSGHTRHADLKPGGPLPLPGPSMLEDEAER